MTPPRTIVLAFLLLAPAAAASGGDATSLERVPYTPHLTVALEPGVDPALFAAALGCRLVAADGHGHVLLAPPPGGGAAVLDKAPFALKGLPGIAYAEIDEDTEPPETAGCSLLLGEVVGQQCTIAWVDGFPSMGTYDSQPTGTVVNAEEAQQLATGTPRTVAVIDTGVDGEHPIFEGHEVLDGWDYLLDEVGGVPHGNGLDDDGDGLVDEAVAHGTHVAGAVVLVDPTARILPLRALDGDGIGSAWTVAQAIFDAVDAGADVINLSLSLRCESNLVAEALMYAEHRGVEVVTSAGNTGAEVLFPGTYHPEDFPLSPPWLPTGVVLDGSNLITVAATDEVDLKAGFSAFGLDVDLCAPGVDVYSAVLHDGFAWWSGTSMAAGVVSGGVSFLLSIAPPDHEGTAGAALKATASSVDDENPAYAGLLGTGRIDVAEAAALVLGP